jgi:hypothetical protein
MSNNGRTTRPKFAERSGANFGLVLLLVVLKTAFFNTAIFFIFFIY